MISPIDRTTKTVLLALALLTANAGMTHAQEPATAGAAPGTRITANYKIYKSGILIGTVEERFIRDGDGYRIVSETQTAGALAIFLRDRVTLASEGRVSAAGLVPATYEMKRQNNAAKDVRAEFDWGRGQIVSHHDGKTESFDLPRGTLDRISAMYQFVVTPPRADEVSVWMSQGKKAERYLYRKQDEPTLKIDGASYPTLHYARDTRAGESKAELWLGKNQHYLPVRIVFEDSRGTSLEQTLVAMSTQ